MISIERVNQDHERLIDLGIHVCSLCGKILSLFSWQTQTANKGVHLRHAGIAAKGSSDGGTSAAGEPEAAAEAPAGARHQLHVPAGRQLLLLGHTIREGRFCRGTLPLLAPVAMSAAPHVPMPMPAASPCCHT